MFFGGLTFRYMYRFGLVFVPKSVPGEGQVVPAFLFRYMYHFRAGLAYALGFSRFSKLYLFVLWEVQVVPAFLGAVQYIPCFAFWAVSGTCTILVAFWYNMYLSGAGAFGNFGTCTIFGSFRVLWCSGVLPSKVRWVVLFVSPMLSNEQLQENAKYM